MNIDSMRERAITPLLLSTLLAACGGGAEYGSTIDMAGKATVQPQAIGQNYTGAQPLLQPGAPQAEGSRNTSVGVGTHLTVPTRSSAGPTHCVMDFSDSAMLQLSGPSLWFDRVYLPWFQQCSGAGHVDFRPTVYSHYHLGFADPEVMPCVDQQAYPSRIDEDGTCHHVNIATEPRTHVTNHWSDETFRLRAMGVSGTSWASFDLNRFRVVGSGSVKLCYKKSGSFSEFEAAGPSDSAPWLCWNELGQGTWDLSQYAWDLAEVKIQASPAGTGSFSVDDFHVSIDQ
jgi:hypothetical protein